MTFSSLIPNHPNDDDIVRDTIRLLEGRQINPDDSGFALSGDAVRVGVRTFVGNGFMDVHLSCIPHGLVAADWSRLRVWLRGGVISQPMRFGPNGTCLLESLTAQPYTIHVAARALESPRSAPSTLRVTIDALRSQRRAATTARALRGTSSSSAPGGQRRSYVFGDFEVDIETSATDPRALYVMVMAPADHPVAGHVHLRFEAADAPDELLGELELPLSRMDEGQPWSADGTVRLKKDGVYLVFGEAKQLQ